MTIDPRITAAVAIQARKGVYSILLGSGVSSAAGIPTGWQVILDLIRSVAKLTDRSEPDDPEAWYVQRFGHEPTYSGLLEQLCPKPSDRSNLLRPYFESTEAERDEGTKAPTAAHKATARLVAEGYVKLVLTTNFDRLMEQSLSEVGVAPQVVATPEAAEGMTPPQHVDCTILKLHGDYLDLATRNTTEELQTYPDQWNEVLDRLLPEYGLIVCGWWAQWDEALRRAILRTTRHRFSTFWLARGAIGERAQRVVDHRQAIIVPIDSADECFVDLEQKVMALADRRRADPLSFDMALATAKRLLAEPRYDIQYDDLVSTEVNRLRTRLGHDDFRKGQHPTEQLFVGRLEQYEAAVASLAGLLVATCRWGTLNHLGTWRRQLPRTVVRDVRGNTSHGTWTRLEAFPACYLVHAGGVAAVANDRQDVVKTLLFDIGWNGAEERLPLVSTVSTSQCLSHEHMNSWVLHQTLKTPGAEYLRTPNTIAV